MIDTRKYEGHTPAPWRGQVDTDGKTEFDEYGSVWKGKDVIALVDDQACDEMFPDADLNLIADAPLLLEFYKRVIEIMNIEGITPSQRVEMIGLEY
tara:strand:- start:703 stop:990 length:288 start_codon:yes stop_codon:yes gene_type:complete